MRRWAATHSRRGVRGTCWDSPARARSDRRTAFFRARGRSDSSRRCGRSSLPARDYCPQAPVTGTEPLGVAAPPVLGRSRGEVAAPMGVDDFGALDPAACVRGASASLRPLRIGADALADELPPLEWASVFARQPTGTGLGEEVWACASPALEDRMAKVASTICFMAPRETAVVFCRPYANQIVHRLQYLKGTLPRNASPSSVRCVPTAEDARFLVASACGKRQADRCAVPDGSDAAANIDQSPCAAMRPG
jgi:hypothetical protein